MRRKTGKTGMSRRFQGRTCPSQQGLAVVCINQLLARPSCNLNDDDDDDDDDDDVEGRPGHKTRLAV